MLRGLNNFSFHGGLADLDTLKGFGVESFRQRLLRPNDSVADTDMGFGDGTPDEIKAIVNKFEASGLRTMYIATLPTLRYLPPASWAEILNEPNLGWSPERYAAYARKAIAICRGREIVPWCGSIANLSKKDLNWLQHVLYLTPEIRNVAVHWYPDKQQRPRPKKGHATRTEEWDHLHRVLQGRPWAMTEFGFSSAGFRKGRWWWKKTGRITDIQQRDLARHEFDLHDDHGAVASYLYQINDGPNDERLHRYGIKAYDGHDTKTYDGPWKPLAGAFR